VLTSAAVAPYDTDWNSYSLRIDFVFRLVFHFALAAALLGCPYVCSSECDACEVKAKSPSNAAQTCSRSCGRTCSRQLSGDESTAPISPSENCPKKDCSCDCLCQGAVPGGSPADVSPITHPQELTDVAAVIVTVSPPTSLFGASPPPPDELSGRALRIAQMSFLC